MVEAPLPAPQGVPEPRTRKTPLLFLFAVIGVLIVIVILSFFFLPQQELTCPSCDDGNPCTEDSCVNGECDYILLDGEQDGCSGDAGVCRKNECVDGACKEVLLNDCCGNGICEEDEHYFTCAEDCEEVILNQTVPDIMEICNDSLDNDGDSLLDCCDPDCNCSEVCGDGIDNDCDSLIDCCDPDCACTEICDDGVDNDCDGKVDAADPDCGAAPVDCEDLVMINEFYDEFGHSTIDAEEDICEGAGGEFLKRVNEVACYVEGVSYYDCDALGVTPPYSDYKDFCENTINADWECQPDYAGCLCDEEPPEWVGENCGDGIDNDADGLIDCMDPDCCPSGMDQCCCEDFHSDLGWESCWPDCDDAYCYDNELCIEVEYLWGPTCECVDEGEITYCEDIDYMNEDATCPDAPCRDSDSVCRPHYDGTLFCDCVDDENEGDNCGDMIDNDNDGLIDCLDPDCCPNDGPCCCEEFFPWYWETGPTEMGCYGAFCYEGTCIPSEGGGCFCSETIPCMMIEDPESQEDCDVGGCDITGQECIYQDRGIGDPYCGCVYDCNDPAASADGLICTYGSWCFSQDTTCVWFVQESLCACPG